MSNRWRRSKPEPPQPSAMTVNPKVSRQQFQVTAQTFYSGPVAHPEFAKEWESVLPGSADRIMTQFEKQAEHRQGIETNQIWWNNFKEVLGMILAFLIFISGVLGGVYLISQGKGTEGLVAVIVSIVVPLALFIAGRRGAIMELRKKRELVKQPARKPQE